MPRQKTLNGQLNNWYKNTKIIITGGGGYLGSNLAKNLVNHKCDLYLIDLKFNEIAESLSKNHPNVYLKTVNLLDTTETEHSIHSIQPDLIYHFAASLNRTRDFLSYPEIYKPNVEIVYNLLMGLRNHDYKGFYFSSTSELYGNIDNPPFYEVQKTMPVSPYSLTKKMAEELLMSFSKLYNKPYTVLRIFNFFGPHQPSSTFIGEMINTYLKEETFVMSKGEQQRDFLYIDELIDQIEFISAKGDANTTYNLCSGKGTSLNDIVNELIQISNNKFKVERSLPYRQNEIMSIIGSNEKLIQQGYQMQNIAMKNALQKCIDAKL